MIHYSIKIKLIQNFFEIINKKLLEITNRSLNFYEVRSIYNTQSELDNLMRFYRVNCNLAQEISDFHSLPMLWSLFAIFTEVLMCLYHLIKEIYISNRILQALNSHDVSHVTFLMILLTVLTKFVTEAIEEV